MTILSLLAKGNVVLNAVDELGLREGSLSHLSPGLQVEWLAALVLHKEAFQVVGVHSEYPAVVSAVKGIAVS